MEKQKRDEVFDTGGWFWLIVAENGWHCVQVHCAALHCSSEYEYDTSNICRMAEHCATTRGAGNNRAFEVLYSEYSMSTVQYSII